VFTFCKRIGQPSGATVILFPEEGVTEEEVATTTTTKEARCRRCRGGRLWLRGKMAVVGRGWITAEGREEQRWPTEEEATEGEGSDDVQLLRQEIRKGRLQQWQQWVEKPHEAEEIGGEGSSCGRQFAAVAGCGEEAATEGWLVVTVAERHGRKAAQEEKGRWWPVAGARDRGGLGCSRGDYGGEKKRQRGPVRKRKWGSSVVVGAVETQQET
ncbi:hypothetical protein GW17_00052370, partial [Ensete ventricosum]